LLEIGEESDVVVVPDLYNGPHYDLTWGFIDKDTIRVTCVLYSIPKSLIEHSLQSELNHKFTLLGTMVTMPSRSLKSIFSLEYFLFIIRPYEKNKEIILKMEKLTIKNETSIQTDHFLNSLRLTGLNHKEKYSVCICYYQTNGSTKAPDLLLCQDIINDYSKFSELRTDPKHGLLFITTQYSIILALLVVLQSVFTMRKRRIAQIIGQHLSTTAHTIRSTFSSSNVTRQSFSSLDTAAEQQHHATSGHTTQREPAMNGEGRMKKRIISSPAIVIREPSISIDNVNNGATITDENEPFLKRIPSKNHVHFLIGPNEGSDDESGDNDNEGIETDITVDPPTASAHREPYDDQADALLSMAHILDTNKPWSCHSHNPSPV
jgi:hypothetical protein